LLVVRALAKPFPLHLPPDLDPAALPRHVTAVQAQEIANRYFGPVASVTIRDAWGLAWREFSGRFVTDTHEFVAEARRRFDATPVHRRGKAPPARPMTEEVCT
jgi:hypothetical protein